MRSRRSWREVAALGLATVGVAGACALGGAVSAGASAPDGSAEGPDVAITGSALDQASFAALDHIGEGAVTDTEVGDEESYYEVEITLTDGSEVDVQLDASFSVVGSEADGSIPD